MGLVVAPDTSDDDSSQPERDKEEEAASPKLDQAERQKNKKKEKTVKTGPCSTQLEGRVGHGNEKVGEKRRSRDACDAEGENTGQGLRGEGGGAGGEKLENKRMKEAKHK